MISIRLITLACLQMFTYIVLCVVYICKYVYSYLCIVKENIPLKKLQDWYAKNHERQLSGRYITAKMIAPLLEQLDGFCTLTHVGNSVANRPIHTLQLGVGKTRVLMWSQMHGNESTTTKAIFDVLLAFQDEDLPSLKALLEQLTICIVPILNPDGAHLYTRNNANDVDLNRDSQTQSQPESVVLKELFERFNPDICFNLHGQRTIFGFEDTGAPSVLSFLSPSADSDRSITLSRKRSMSIITSINDTFKELLPKQIGRYDDGFNINCVGDTFQNKEVPTVLFEAGHTPNDYEREICREYIFLSIISALKASVTEEMYDTSRYFEIPEHQKCYCDILIKNTSSGDIAIMYQECLKGDKVVFIPKLADNTITKAFFGHRVIEAKGGEAKIVFKDKEDEMSDIVELTLNNERIL